MTCLVHSMCVYCCVPLCLERALSALQVLDVAPRSSTNDMQRPEERRPLTPHQTSNITVRQRRGVGLTPKFPLPGASKPTLPSSKDTKTPGKLNTTVIECLVGEIQSGKYQFIYW